MQFDTLPDISTPRLRLRLLEPHEAPLMVQFRKENRSHLEVWEPSRRPEFFTDGFWQIQLRAALREFRQGQSVCLVLLDPEASQVLGVCNFTGIIRGTFQACHLGYSLSHRHEGKGLMAEALNAAINYMFEVQKLHRIMANYLPHNDRSGRLLARLGFEIEGRGRQFLKINGRWEDHVLTSLLNPESF